MNLGAAVLVLLRNRQELGITTPKNCQGGKGATVNRKWLLETRKGACLHPGAHGGLLGLLTEGAPESRHPGGVDMWKVKFGAEDLR